MSSCAADPAAGPDPRHSTLEGVARVVAVEDGIPWLEPEPASGCGGCRSLASCGGGGGRPGGRHRFTLADLPQPRIGERVVVVIPGRSLVLASLVVYAIPLLTLLGAGSAMFLTGADDFAGALAALTGLGVGVWISRCLAGRLSARDDLSPRFLRKVH